MLRTKTLGLLISCGAFGIDPGLALGQAAFRAVFVANNGNLEGSVSSFRVNGDGSVSFVSELNTGLNAFGISLSPSGRLLASSHTTASTTTEQITVMRVANDATLSLLAVFQTPDSPLDLRWIREDLLAVTLTNVSAPNKVIMYRFVESPPSLTEIDRYDTGSFNSYLALHPSRQALYTQDSTGATVNAWQIQPNGTLTLLDSESTAPAFALWMQVSPDGTKLYVAGGASSSDEKVNGFHIAADGSLTPMAGNPFVVARSSPKVLAFSQNGAFLLVGFARRSEVRSYAIDPQSGALSDSGFLFSFPGIQGDLGTIASLDNLTFVVDRFTSTNAARGLFSTSVAADGSFSQIGGIVDTQGISPDRLVVWDPPTNCPDLTGDGRTNESDLGLLLQNWQAGPGGDLNQDGATDESDLGILLQNWLCS